MNPTRRAIIAAFAGVPLIGSTAGADGGTLKGSGASALVAYFSRTGNTRVVAGLIKSCDQRGVFEIRPAAGYPEDYLTTIEQARQERDRGFAPPLASRVSDMDRYDTVYWGLDGATSSSKFPEAHDLAGKVLIPFATHGGYGIGSSEAVLAAHAPRATLREEFTMEADQERRTMEAVTAWLASR